MLGYVRVNSMFKRSNLVNLFKTFFTNKIKNVTFSLNKQLLVSMSASRNAALQETRIGRTYYEVIISLTVVFTLGPFRESFMSLRNMDKFCVNLLGKRNHYRLCCKVSKFWRTYLGSSFANSVRSRPWGSRTTGPWPPACPGAGCGLCFPASGWNIPRSVISSRAAAETSTTGSGNLRTWSHSKRCWVFAEGSPGAPPGPWGTCH